MLESAVAKLGIDPLSLDIALELPSNEAVRGAVVAGNVRLVLSGNDFGDVGARGVARQCEEVGVLLERSFELGLKRRSVQLDGAELAEMLRHELRVEKREPTTDQPRGEVNKRDLRGVALRREHAFAEECAFERHAVEAADQLIAVPDFNRVAGAEVEQFTVKGAYARVDPGRHASCTRGRATVDHAVVVAVDFDLKWSRADCAQKTPRNMEAIER